MENNKGVLNFRNLKLEQQIDFLEDLRRALDSARINVTQLIDEDTTNKKLEKMGEFSPLIKTAGNKLINLHSELIAHQAVVIGNLKTSISILEGHILFRTKNYRDFR